MLSRLFPWLALLTALVLLVNAQQQCYFGPGAENRGPAELVPCVNDGQSACCLQGDTCLSGNTCYNYKIGNVYQYGCTDITYTDASCPYKCGFNTTLSPWTALEYCNDVQGVNDTWVCHAPESCNCEWNSTTDLLVLKQRSCLSMGSDARVALYAPSALAPFVSLPASRGGSTGYYSGTTSNGTSTWVTTAVSGYTPSPIAELTTYGDQPTTPVLINADLKPATATLPAAVYYTSSTSSVVSASTSSSSQTSSTASTTSSITAAATLVSTPQPTPTRTASTPALTTGTKVGIGVGVAGGACLVAALIVAIILMRKRNNKTQQHSEQPQPSLTYQSQRYPGQAPPYFTEAEKAAWQAGYPITSPMLSPYYGPSQASLYQGVPASYKPMPPPPMPTELSGEDRPMELHSETSGPHTPSPAYAAMNRMER